MNATAFAKLRNGSRVLHVDGTSGTIERSPEYRHIVEIVWDDGQRQLMRTDSKTDCDWIESDIVQANNAQA